MVDCQENKYIGLKAAKEGEKETEEQKEMRLGRFLNRIEFKYSGIFLKEIEDKRRRDVVRRIRALGRKNKEKKKQEELETVNKSEFVERIGEKQLANIVIKLRETRNATDEQMLEIAKLYGMDLKEIKRMINGEDKER